MTFEIEIEGRTRTVSVERLGADRYRMVLDGHTHVLSAARVGAFGYSLILDGEASTSRDVHVAPTGTIGELLVHLDGQVAAVTTNGRAARRGSRDAAGSAGGEQKVVAPMPGRIVKVLVGPGDEVAARQGVVVVEAMKMENELRAPRSGRVREVSVSPGASVEAGRVLVVLE
jgi:acetyl/propionyl-CoA carboxylase alpha subunit